MVQQLYGLESDEQIPSGTHPKSLEPDVESATHAPLDDEQVSDAPDADPPQHVKAVPEKVNHRVSINHTDRGDIRCYTNLLIRGC